MLVDVKLLLCCAILPTSYMDNNGYLKKLKKAVQMIWKQILIVKNTSCNEEKVKSNWASRFCFTNKKVNKKIAAEFSLICYKNMSESYIS